jgi:hypothetical protein
MQDRIIVQRQITNPSIIYEKFGQPEGRRGLSDTQGPHRSEPIHASTCMQHHFCGLYTGIQICQPIMPKDTELIDHNINEMLYLNFTVMHCNAENQRFILATQQHCVQAH